MLRVLYVAMWTGYVFIMAFLGWLLWAADHLVVADRWLVPFTMVATAFFVLYSFVIIHLDIELQKERDSDQAEEN